MPGSILSGKAPNAEMAIEELTTIAEVGMLAAATGGNVVEPQTLTKIETSIQSMLFWDTGDSRLFLWASAIITFMVVVGTVSHVFGWLVRKLVERLMPATRK